MIYEREPNQTTQPTHQVTWRGGHAWNAIISPEGLWIRGSSGAWAPWDPAKDDYNGWKFEPELSPEEINVVWQNRRRYR